MPVLVACALGVAFLLALVWASARSAVTIAVAEVRDGKLEIVRGGLSPRVLGDLRDVVARPRVRSATLRIVRAKDHARVEVRGKVSEQQVQRLRNVVGNVPVAQLVKAKRT
ncbi:MAG TPA: DUF3634 family protein [Polyangiaceae bacterium]|jgi:hypothetical protein